MKTIGIERKRPRRLRSCVDWQPRALCRGELTDRQAEDSGRILGSDSEGYKHADFVKLVDYQDGWSERVGGRKLRDGWISGEGNSRSAQSRWKNFLGGRFSG